jgi:hypothetical protein
VGERTLDRDVEITVEIERDLVRCESSHIERPSDERRRVEVVWQAVHVYRRPWEGKGAG